MSRTEFLGVRLTQGEKAKLERRAAQFGVTASQFVRKLIDAADRRVREPELELDGERLEIGSEGAQP